VLANAYATLWLRPGAPEAVVKAAFHSLAQIHHPDAGGDAEFMARINEAYATIQANQPRLIS
jgi:DnaJ-class molecular chaperone